MYVNMNMVRHWIVQKHQHISTTRWRQYTHVNGGEFSSTKAQITIVWYEEEEESQLAYSSLLINPYHSEQVCTLSQWFLNRMLNQALAAELGS